MAFGPTGTKVDVTVVGTDGHPYRASADSPDQLVHATFKELGGPTAKVRQILKDGWLADGSDYVVIAKGEDSRVYIWTDSSQAWKPMDKGVAGTVS